MLFQGSNLHLGHRRTLPARIGIVHDQQPPPGVLRQLCPQAREELGIGPIRLAASLLSVPRAHTHRLPRRLQREPGQRFLTGWPIRIIENTILKKATRRVHESRQESRKSCLADAGFSMHTYNSSRSAEVLQHLPELQLPPKEILGLFVQMRLEQQLPHTRDRRQRGSRQRTRRCCRRAPAATVEGGEQGPAGHRWDRRAPHHSATHIRKKNQQTSIASALVALGSQQHQRLVKGLLDIRLRRGHGLPERRSEHPGDALAQPAGGANDVLHACVDKRLADLLGGADEQHDHLDGRALRVVPPEQLRQVVGAEPDKLADVVLQVQLASLTVARQVNAETRQI
mmetsp:Transcript_1030/g.3030  ORF Transcript_1030/g.3030 Transcript_1030/m.3030 type:complete len:341 (+) Transcript_1030:517-1539(+)